MREHSPEELTEEYEGKKGNYDNLCKELEFSLKKKIDEAGIKWHSIIARSKTLESFLEKIERKGYADPFNETEDLAGVRVVCLFMGDLQRTEGVISSIFDVLHKEDKINDGDVSAFGYMSHHYICKLSDRYAGERYDSIKGLKFEIQVRTILMDAWANMSHYLNYKSEESIPKDLIKDFHALSALLYVGDRQFEGFYTSSSRSAAAAEEAVLRSSEIQATEVNADTIQALLERMFPERRPASAESIADLISELREFGYNDLTEIDQIVQANKDAAIQKERKAKIHDDQGEIIKKAVKYNRAGIVRAAFDFHDPKIREYRLKKTRHRLEVKISGHKSVD
ncbi:GTP pyrophosphokinase [Streptomyces rubiginosohelvolus]|uniref:GTP pyrophosphokinase n=1 Tax=Streptomyces rubiginosohelvolus TaxID=67362 RepID=UPI0036AE9840